jgi:hypothetical protein
MIEISEVLGSDEKKRPYRRKIDIENSEQNPELHV